LDLVVEHVNLHGEFDSAYTAYRLPGQFLEVARQNGREAEFIELHKRAVRGLDAAIERRLTSKPVDSVPVERLPGIVFRSLFEDSDLSFHRWTAEMMVLRDELRSMGSE
jgi:pyruvate dehydrogenase complex dehydrogenase (E1) component